MEDKIVGKHLYANAYNPEEKRVFDDVEFLVNLVKEMVKAANATLVEVKGWSFGGKKGGISVIALVEESHIAIHTWREYNYLTIDIYTCGSHTDPWKAWKLFLEKVKPERYSVNYADRSML